ncbi:MAG TPA: hypothetical protein ENG51_18340 [Deltaproteobacteria bacterium]|nr:MAG: hypothetical protein DRG83_11610 [Deltaproteobacteria bacterium]RLB09789.1 MAG: hypothetical protein DRG59_01350 [Deltaproteobacteria bacterium]HDM78398.1 hypothetical protein [Deltaproteobacteria bacterium]
MLIDVNVNIALDLTLGALSHFTIPPLPPAPNFSVEIIATQMWTCGYFLNQNKLTKKVFHKGFFIVLDGHDIGAMIPDITPAQMANAYYSIMWPFSSRKIVFKTTKVEMEKTPVGCSQIFLAPLPMQTCGDPISAPTSFPLTNKFNTVVVGMTLKDLFMGILTIGLSMAIDFVFAKWGEGLDKFVKRKIFKRVAEEAAKEVVEKVTKKAILKKLASELAGKLVPTSPSAVAKMFVAGAAGFGTSSLEGNPTFKLTTGGAPAGGEVSYSWGKEPGFKAQGNVLGWQRDTAGKGANWGEPL